MLSTPLSRPRPPLRRPQSRHVSSTSTAGAESPVLSRVKRTPDEYLGRLDESPLSAAAQLLRESVPGVLDDIPHAESLAQAWGWTDGDVPLDVTVDALDDQASAGEHDIDVNNGEPLTQDWIAQRSRDELEALLLQADRVIRERERDLGIAASIGKSLLENNVALRARQDQLALAAAASSTDSSPHPHSLLPRSHPHPRRAQLIQGLPPPSPAGRHSRESSFDWNYTEHDDHTLESDHGGGDWTDDSLDGHRTALHKSHDGHSRSASSSTSPSPRRKAFKRHRKNRSSVSVGSGFSPNSTRRSNPYSSSPLSLVHYGAAGSGKHTLALQKLEHQNEVLATQLAAIEAEARVDEIEGKRRLQKMRKEVEALKIQLHFVEERNDELEAGRFDHGPDSEDELGRQAEQLIKGMKKAILDDVVVSEIDWGTKNSHAHDDDGTSVDSGPHSIGPDTPIASEQPAFIPAVSVYAPLSTSASQASLSSVGFSVHGTNHRRLGQETESANLVASLMVKVSELQDSQMAWNHERMEMGNKLNKAKSEVESLRMEVEGVERLVGVDGDPSRLSVSRGTGFGGSPGWSGIGSVRKAKGNSERIASRRMSGQIESSPRSFRYSAYSRHEDENDDHANSTFVRGTPTHLSPVRPSHRRFYSSPNSTGNSPIRPLLLKSSPERDHLMNSPPASLNLDRSLLHGNRTLASEVGSIFGGGESSTHSSPVKTNQRDLTYAEVEQAVDEMPVRWEDDDTSTCLAPTSYKRLVCPPSPTPAGNRLTSRGLAWGFHDDSLEQNTGALWKEERHQNKALESQDVMEERQEVDRLMLQRRLVLKNRHDSASGSRHGSILGGTSTERGRDSSVDTVAGLSRHGRNLTRYGEVSESEDQYEEDDERVEEEEADSGWNYLTALDHDHRPNGARGTDYYPVTLTARHAPKMVVQRLQDHGIRWILLGLTWLQFLVTLAVAVGWAISKGPTNKRAAVTASETKRGGGGDRKGRSPSGGIERKKIM